jgi:hypothetical protein
MRRSVFCSANSRCMGATSREHSVTPGRSILCTPVSYSTG